VWKVLIAFLVLIVILAGAGVAAAWRYDAAREDRLAEGISIAGVDVGGMRVADARAALDGRIDEPLTRPISVLYRGGQFVFTPSKAAVATNLDAELDAALEESRDGNFLGRAFRDFSGGRLSREADLEVTYSEQEVGHFAARVARRVDSEPKDGKSKASFAGVRIWPSHNGVLVRRADLTAALEDALVDPRSTRAIDLPTRVLRPETTTRELEKRFHVFLAVSRSKKELRYYVKEKLVRTYPVAIGRIGFETPAGLYEIQTKAVNPAWYVPKKAWAGDLAGKIIPPGDPENPLKARWMGFWDGAGIHGTAESSSIGSAASHGCIRMTVPDVIDLYDRVPLHTPLLIS
jgi:L,D-transpeptidase catalytic domain/Putative peptidoglycan binding domain